MVLVNYVTGKDCGSHAEQKFTQILRRDIIEKNKFVFAEMSYLPCQTIDGNVCVPEECTQFEMQSLTTDKILYSLTIGRTYGHI